jgi:hypothetical protein
MQDLSVAELKQKIKQVRKEMHPALKSLKKADLISELERFAPPPPPEKVKKTKAKAEESDELPMHSGAKNGIRKAPAVVSVEKPTVKPAPGRLVKGSPEAKERMAQMRAMVGKKKDTKD